MTDLTDQQIDEMLQRVKRWSWPRQYGKSVIVDLVNAIPSLLAAKKEAVARAQKAEAEAALNAERAHVANAELAADTTPEPTKTVHNCVPEGCSECRSAIPEQEAGD